mgnify:FL=1
MLFRSKVIATATAGLNGTAQATAAAQADQVASALAGLELPGLPNLALAPSQAAGRIKRQAVQAPRWDREVVRKVRRSHTGHAGKRAGI